MKQSIQQEGTEHDNLFTRIGVRPLVNARGTYTILSGSMEEDLIKFRAIMRAERYLSRRLELNDAKGA